MAIQYSSLPILFAQKIDNNVSINIPGGVWSAKVNSNTNMVYVINPSSNSITAFNGTENTIDHKFQFNTSLFDTLAINEKRNTIYGILANGKIAMMDGNSNNLSYFGISPLILFNQIDVNPQTTKLYVTDSSANATYVIDEDDEILVTTITNIKTPWKIAVNSATNKIYITSLYDDSVHLIDGLTDKVVSSIHVGFSPSSIAVDPELDLIYVSNSLGNRISIIDGGKNELIRTVSLNFTDQNRNIGSELDVDLNTHRVFISPVGSKVIHIIDPAGNKISNSLYLPAEVRDFVFNSMTDTLYVTHYEDSAISVVLQPSILSSDKNYIENNLDLRGESPELLFGQGERDVVVNPHTNLIYSLDPFSSKIDIIDGTSHKSIGKIDLPASGTDMDINPYTNVIYVISPQTNSLFFVDAYSNTVTKNLTLNGSLKSVAVNPNTNIIYVTNNHFYLFDMFGQRTGEQNSLFIIDGDTNSLINELAIDVGNDIAIDPNTDRVYLSNKSLFHDRADLKDQIVIIEDLSNDARSFGTDLKEAFFILDNFAIDENMITDISVDSNLGILYVILANMTGKDKFLYTIDPFVTDPKPLSRVVIPSVTEEQDDIAINSKTGLIYLGGGVSNKIFVINETAKSIRDINLGRPVSHLVIDEKTNTIYSSSSNTPEITSINGYTNEVIVEATIDVNPPNAGYVQCNEKQIWNTYVIKGDQGNLLQCRAIPQKGFAFLSWSGSMVSDNEPDSSINLNLTRGTLAANFIIPVEAFLSTEVLVSIIAGPILGWLIAYVVQILKERTQKRTINLIMKRIEQVLKNSTVDKKSEFDRIIMDVQNIYSAGKISETQHDTLYSIVSYLKTFVNKLD